MAFGLSIASDSRRLNDYLLRLGPSHVEALESVCRAVAVKVAPSVAAHRFDSNRAFYLLGQLAQNLLIAIQYGLLPEEARRHGIRTVIRELVRVAGRLVRHGRKWVMKFAKTSLRLGWISHAADRLDSGEAFVAG